MKKLSSFPDLRNMLAQLIAIPSVSCISPHLDMSNLAIIELLADWLEQLGFATEIMPLADNPKKANLLATLGSGSGGLVLSGHTDTVPYDENLWQSDPFKMTEDQQRLYGLGICDMKCFFPIAITAAQAFLDQPLKHPLMILATADEETSMAGARALVDIGKPKARYAVIGEPTGLRPVIMHKGITMTTINIQGKTGHSSNPAAGANALDAMNQVMNTLIQFRQELQRKHQNPQFTVSTPTLNLGCIHGGDNPNRICGACELQFDLRTLPGMSNTALHTTIKERLAPIEKQFGVTLAIIQSFAGIPAFQVNDPCSEFVKCTEKLTGHAGISVAFGTEAPFFQQLGIDTLILGAGDIAQAHQPNEYLLLDRINPNIDILQKLIARFCLGTSE